MAEDDTKRPNTLLLRRFVNISFGFWSGETRNKAIVFVVCLFVCLLLNLMPAIAVNRWNKAFFDALQQRDQSLIIYNIGLIATLAGISAITSVALMQVRMRFQLGWREWLTQTLVHRWMEKRHFYQLSVLHLVDNPEARIAEDGRISIELFVDFVTGVTNALLMSASFVSVLWFVGGSFTIFGLNVPGYLVFAVVIYSACTSFCMFLLGRPLVKRVESKAAAEADFRFELSHTRENAESIALVGGDDAERLFHKTRFNHVVKCWLDVINQQSRMLILSSGNNILSPVIPLLLGSPKYLAGEMSLGDLMQATAAFVQVQLALNWLADNSTRLADWFASARRVAALDSIYDGLDNLECGSEPNKIELGFSDDQSLHLCDLSISQNDGSLILEYSDLVINRGDRILVKGESGTGKSTLIRAIAGLWPWGSGRVLRPKDSSIAYMPQQPYLPHGTLLQALHYPDNNKFTDQIRIVNALKLCGLSHLIPRLAEYQNWSEVLSGGEQQLIGFARIIISPPDIIIMDEPFSSLDNLSQTRLMELLIENAPETTIIHASRHHIHCSFYNLVIMLEPKQNPTCREDSSSRVTSPNISGPFVQKPY